MDAERAFLAAIGGGCSAPVSAHARVRDGEISIHAFASDPRGASILRADESGPAEQGIAIAERLASNLLERGAADLLSRVPGFSVEGE